MQFPLTKALYGCEELPAGEEETLKDKEERSIIKEIDTGSDYSTDFLQEEIKSRPINRARLARRMLIVACMAAVFGTVACLFFLLLEPVINRMLNPEEPVQGVTYPEEKPYEELTPEEMRENEEERAATAEQEMIREEVQQYLREGGIDAITYEQIMGGLRDVAEECKPWLTEVSGITEDVDWFNAPYENRGTVTGMVIAKGEDNLLVLACTSGIEQAQRVQVTFNGGLVGYAHVQGYDSGTGMAVLSVPVNTMHRIGEEPEETEQEEEDDSQETEEDTAVREQELDMISVVELGSSAPALLTGRTVIAVGRPAGTTGSISYGFVSSVAPGIEVPDCIYKQVTTDIYGGRNSSGVLVNIRGEAVGIIDPAHGRSDMPDVLCAVGITELKALIEQLSIGREVPYFGIYYTDIPGEVRMDQRIPEGVYISRVREDSPALEAGIQKGDIITAFGEESITSSIRLSSLILHAEEETPVKITVARQDGTGYAEMEFEVTPN